MYTATESSPQVKNTRETSLIRVNYSEQMIITTDINHFREIPIEWAKSSGYNCPLSTHIDEHGLTITTLQKGWTWVYNTIPLTTGVGHR